MVLKWAVACVVFVLAVCRATNALSMSEACELLALCPLCETECAKAEPRDPEVQFFINYCQYCPVCRVGRPLCNNALLRYMGDSLTGPLGYICSFLGLSSEYSALRSLLKRLDPVRLEEDVTRVVGARLADLVREYVSVSAGSPIDSAESTSNSRENTDKVDKDHL
ncbi:MAG: hypothetical protein MHM6MM_006690 [Cercozoa sp. M6MM]